MDWTLLTYSTFVWLGLLGLYSLRNMSARNNFSSMGPIIGFATIVQKLTVSIGFLTFITVAIIKSTWYTPFLVLLIGAILSGILGLVLTKLKLMRLSTQKSEFGMLLSALLTLISLLLMIFYDYKN